MPGARLSEKDEVMHEIALTVVAMTPSLEKASEIMLAEYGVTVSVAKLEVHKRLYRDRYEKICEQVAARNEKMLEHELMVNASLGTNAVRMAVERSEELLRNGECRDPSRVARDLADVVAKSVDKRQLLRGNPTSIVQTRTSEEILRQLEAMGVVETI